MNYIYMGLKTFDCKCAVTFIFSHISLYKYFCVGPMPQLYTSSSETVVSTMAIHEKKKKMKGRK